MIQGAVVVPGAEPDGATVGVAVAEELLNGGAVDS